MAALKSNMKNRRHSNKNIKNQGVNNHFGGSFNLTSSGLNEMKFNAWMKFN